MVSTPSLSLNVPGDTTSDYFERNVARLLIVLHDCGQPVADLISGQIRQIEPRSRLVWYDFWVREPGHLALALIQAYGARRAQFNAELQVEFHAAIERLLAEDHADTRRVALGTSGLTPVIGDLDGYLSFMAGRALVSDRPSFVKGGMHRVVIEPEGIQFVSKLLDSCALLNWYREQCQMVMRFAPILEGFELNSYTYLGMSPAIAASMPLVPVIKERYDRLAAG